jgi:MFS family permease
MVCLISIINGVKKFFITYLSYYKGINFAGWLILISNLVNRIGSATVLFLSVYFHTKLNYSLTQVGVLLGLYGFGSIVGSLTGGMLSVKFRPILILIFSLFISSILFWFLSFINHYYSLLILLFCLGLFVSIGQPAISLLLNSCVDNSIDRLKIFSLYRVMNNIGVSITGIVGGILATYSFEYIFYLDSITSFLSSCFLLFFLSSYKLYEDRKMNTQENLLDVRFKNVLIDKYFMILWVILLFVLLIFSQVMTAYPIYLHESYKLSTENIGAVFSLNGILIAIFQVPLTHKMKNIDLHLSAMIGVIFIGVGFAILPLSTSLVVALLSCIIWTFGEMLFFPTNMTLVLNHIDSSYQGKYMAIYDLAFSISKLFFPALGMSIYQFIGGNNLWAIFGFVSVFIAALLLKMKSLEFNNHEISKNE